MAKVRAKKIRFATMIVLLIWLIRASAVKMKRLPLNMIPTPAAFLRRKPYLRLTNPCGICGENLQPV
jgi:hypothetical protein